MTVILIVAMTSGVRRSLPGVLAVVLASGDAAAQQREPALEVFFLTGVNTHGNLLLAPQSNSAPARWRPQFGAELLAPLGSRWGVLAGIATSAAGMNWKWDGMPDPGPEDNFTRVRRLTSTPAIIRLWRRERFSIYAGGGAGIEHDRQRIRLRPIAARDPAGRPIVASEFVSQRATGTQASPAFRTGVIISLTRRLSAHAGYSYVRRYVDERGSQGLIAAIGFRL